jgi:hypothetical protein
MRALVNAADFRRGCAHFCPLPNVPRSRQGHASYRPRVGGVSGAGRHRGPPPETSPGALERVRLPCRSPDGDPLWRKRSPGSSPGSAKPGEPSRTRFPCATLTSLRLRRSRTSLQADWRRVYHGAVVCAMSGSAHSRRSCKSPFLVALTDDAGRRVATRVATGVTSYVPYTLRSVLLGRPPHRRFDPFRSPASPLLRGLAS